VILTVFHRISLELECYLLLCYDLNQLSAADDARLVSGVVNVKEILAGLLDTGLAWPECAIAQALPLWGNRHLGKLEEKALLVSEFPMQIRQRNQPAN